MSFQASEEVGFSGFVVPLEDIDKLLEVERVLLDRSSLVNISNLSVRLLYPSLVILSEGVVGLAEKGGVTVKQSWVFFSFLGQPSQCGASEK